jgi:hypothetical protein
MGEGAAQPDAGNGGEPPRGRDSDDPPGRCVVVYGGSIIGGFLVFLAGDVLVSPLLGLAGGLVFALIVVAQGRRGPGARPTRR